MTKFALTKASPPVFGSAGGLWLVQICAIVLALLLGAASSTTGEGGNGAGLMTVIATAAFLVGGLPHGAFDIHLAAEHARMGRSKLAVFTALYVGLFAIMLVGWAVAPAIVLPIFLITAVIHFGADWPETNEPVYRVALGFAPICAIGIGHISQVEAIFAAMATPDIALWATKCFILAAPVTLLIAAIALFVIASGADWRRPALFAVLLATLIIVPPLIGFALFFCVFHTPRHLAEIRINLGHWRKQRLIMVGAAITGLAMVLGALALPLIFMGGLLTAATGFQLLAALAMPHQSMGLILRLLNSGTNKEVPIGPINRFNRVAERAVR
jgi:Brp/Blh family beta-carotene 15,15'-monooxygenase